MHRMRRAWLAMAALLSLIGLAGCSALDENGGSALDLPSLKSLCAHVASSDKMTEPFRKAAIAGLETAINRPGQSADTREVLVQAKQVLVDQSPSSPMSVKARRTITQACSQLGTVVGSIPSIGIGNPPTATAGRSPSGTKSKVTAPSGRPNPNAKPTGRPKAIPPKADAATKRALRLENEAAVTLARAGFTIEQLPDSKKQQKNPDFRIEGRIFDCYAPTSSNVRNLWSNIEIKVVAGQADRIVVNLHDPPGEGDGGGTQETVPRPSDARTERGQGHHQERRNRHDLSAESLTGRCQCHFARPWGPEPRRPPSPLPLQTQSTPSIQPTQPTGSPSRRHRWRRLPASECMPARGCWSESVRRRIHHSTRSRRASVSTAELSCRSTSS